MVHYEEADSSRFHIELKGLYFHHFFKNTTETCVHRSFQKCFKDRHGFTLCSIIWVFVCTCQVKPEYWCKLNWSSVFFPQQEWVLEYVVTIVNGGCESW